MTEFEREARPSTRAFVLWFIICFGYFHLYIYFIWYFWNLAVEVPLCFGTALFLLLTWRFHVYGLIRVHDKEQPNSSTDSIGFALETIAWYVLMFLLFAFLQRHFGFPGTLNSNWKVIALGYLLFFIGAIPISILITGVVKAIEVLLKDLLSFIDVLPRLFAVFFLYLAVDIFFAVIYRINSIWYPKSVVPKLESFADSFYFSTVTITTIGYGDILPKSAMMRMLVSFEAFLGILLLAGILSTAISIGLASHSGSNRRILTGSSDLETKRENPDQ